MKINLNELAKLITEEEGKRLSVSIAQVKEIMAILGNHMLLDPSIALHLMDRANKRFLKEMDSKELKKAKRIKVV